MCDDEAPPQLMSDGDMHGGTDVPDWFLVIECIVLMIWALVQMCWSP